MQSMFDGTPTSLGSSAPGESTKLSMPVYTTRCLPQTPYEVDATFQVNGGKNSVSLSLSGRTN